MAGAQIPLMIMGTAMQYNAQQTEARNLDKAAAEQEKLSILNAAAVEEEGAEQARRLAAEQKKTEASSQARAAASGMGKSESTGTYLDDMQKEHDKEMAWLNRSTKTQSRLARAGGTTEANISRSKASGIRTSSGASAVMSAASWFAQ